MLGQEMAALPVNAATHVAESLADKAMQELEYLCCYKSFVDDFDEEQPRLRARRDTVLKDIEEAKDRSENQIENEVELWLERANGLIQEDTKGKEKWFGLVTNCFWQYSRGKALERKAKTIKQLMEQSNNFPRVARSTGLPGIEFYSSANFMQLKDRKLQSEKLQVALKDDNKFMIGLYGLGGTGKTTMAIEVGKEVADSKVFDKVIFNVVSKDANRKKIRDNIAKHLNFSFKEEKDESEQAQKLWKRIAEREEKMLIILDDVWEKLTLRDIGIPLGRHGKGCCAILLTTRDWRVCRDMGCHEIVELEVLNEKDAVDLFLSYAGKSIDGSSNDFKDVALGIVKECGRLPVAIVAVARALKSRPLKEWKESLERLRNPEPIHDVNEDLKEAYNSLRLSYDHLKNEKAKRLFLLCALFPEDYEIPIELLTRIGRCLGLCGEANKYSTTRIHFTPIKNELMDSCLLLKAENEAVKMHDLVREVALWIGNKLVQVAMDSSTTLMKNIQYSSWNIIDFPNHFDGRELEVLFLWISNADSPTVKVPDAIFEGLGNLKMLALMSLSEVKISAASLFQSHLSLINVGTLTIKGFELEDISILANLKSLESLELNQCSIIELPNEIRELEKLRLLEMVDCDIEKNNPFEVIGSCMLLEELYFVLNRMDKYTYESPAQSTTLSKLERYQIKAWRSFSNYKVDFSISRYFDSRDLTVNFSDEIFKSLVARAEVLKLDGDYYKRGQTSIVPDILPVEDDSEKDYLTKLHVRSMNMMKCLIHTEHLRSGVAIFSKLVELKLKLMDVRKLCWGPYPVDFLKRLEKLHLSWCENLEGTLFDDKLELCNLKSIGLSYCSMTCLFHPSTAQSLKQIEILHIGNCVKLKYIIAETTDGHAPNQKSQYDSVFPEMKQLYLQDCPELEFILPICFCEDLPLLESLNINDCKKLEYIFGQYPEERDLHQMGKEAILQLLEEVEIGGVPNFINIYAECYIPRPSSDEARKSSPSTKVEDGSSSSSRGHLCCFWPKSNASTMHHPSTSINHNQVSKVKYSVNRAHRFFTPPLYPYTHLRWMVISRLFGLKSIFTLSIVSTLKLLEILKVDSCNTLEHIIIEEEHGCDHMHVNCIFPKLQEIYVYNCSHLEYIFPAFYSKDFKDLESVEITKAEEMKHVFGKCQADQNHNVQVDLNLPALKLLDLDDIPNMVSICAQNYSMKALYLEYIRLEGCPQLRLETLTDLLVVGHERQEDLSKRKALYLEEKGKPLSNLQEFPEFKEPKSYMSFQNLSHLYIRRCKQLKFIFSASTSRRLQKLRRLKVSECEELVSIIEDEENQKNPMAPYQVCFPELLTIEVRDCKSMKCLFPISSGRLPRLMCLSIQGAPQLEQVFRWKHGEEQKLVVEDVFPKLMAIRLINLPTLHNICQGIDFQTVNVRLVHGCPAISLTSADDSDFEQLYDSFKRSIVDEDVHYAYFTISDWALTIRTRSRKAIEEDSREHKQNRISPNLIEEEGSQEDIEKDLIMPQQNNGSPNIENSEEVSKMIAEKDSTTHQQNNNLLNSTESTNASENEIVEEKLSTTPPSDSDMELCGKESMGDQQALGESRSSNIEAPERVEKPTNKCYSKETSNEMPLMFPPSITRISPPPQIETSAAQVEVESRSSTIIDQSAQIEEEGSQEDIGKESTMPQENNGSPNFEHSTNASANEIVEEKLSTTTSSNSNMYPKATFAEGPSLQKYDKASSSTYSTRKIEEPYELTPSKELCGKESMGDQHAFGESRSSNEAPQRVEEHTNECSSRETSNEMALMIPPSVTGMTSPLPQKATSTAHVEMESGSFAITDQSAQDKIMNQPETSTEKQIKFDQGNHQQFEEHDLMRLFQIMKEGADVEVDMPCVSKIVADLQDNKEVSKALADLEGSLKMSLNEIATSEESRLRLENALNILSSHYSEDGPLSHGLQATIHSLQQEIQTILSSSNQAYATIDTFTKLEQKRKLMVEQRSKREKDAKTLLFNIHNTKNSIVEAQLNEVELKEHISKLQAELRSKEKEIEECEWKLLSLQEQEKKSVSDTIRFTMEFLAMEKERSHMVEDQMNARQQLENMDAKWSFCLSNLKKATMLLRLHLKQKL